MELVSGWEGREVVAQWLENDRPNDWGELVLFVVK